jgi:invasion protein IalB
MTMPHIMTRYTTRIPDLPILILFAIATLTLASPLGLHAAMTGDATAPSVTPPAEATLQETYRDWDVLCLRQGDGRRCTMSQVQAQPDDQRRLTVEISALSNNGATGMLALPLRPDLQSGVTLQIDDQPAMTPRYFRFCLPNGCLVPLFFDAAALTALRGGTLLRIAMIADDGADTVFSLSLAGFAPASDRLAVLTQ